MCEISRGAQKKRPQPHHKTATGYGRLLQPHQPDHESGCWVAGVDWDYLFFSSNFSLLLFPSGWRAFVSQSYLAKDTP